MASYGKLALVATPIEVISSLGITTKVDNGRLAKLGSKFVDMVTAEQFNSMEIWGIYVICANAKVCCIYSTTDHKVTLEQRVENDNTSLLGDELWYIEYLLENKYSQYKREFLYTRPETPYWTKSVSIELYSRMERNENNKISSKINQVVRNKQGEYFIKKDNIESTLEQLDNNYEWLTYHILVNSKKWCLVTSIGINYIFGDKDEGYLEIRSGCNSKVQILDKQPVQNAEYIRSLIAILYEDRAEIIRTDGQLVGIINDKDITSIDKLVKDGKALTCTYTSRNTIKTGIITDNINKTLPNVDLFTEHIKYNTNKILKITDNKKNAIKCLTDFDTRPFKEYEKYKDILYNFGITDIDFNTGKIQTRFGIEDYTKIAQSAKVILSLCWLLDNKDNFIANLNGANINYSKIIAYLINQSDTDCEVCWDDFYPFSNYVDKMSNYLIQYRSRIYDKRKAMRIREKVQSRLFGNWEKEALKLCNDYNKNIHLSVIPAKFTFTISNRNYHLDFCHQVISVESEVARNVIYEDFQKAEIYDYTVLGLDGLSDNAESILKQDAEYFDKKIVVICNLEQIRYSLLLKCIAKTSGINMQWIILGRFPCYTKMLLHKGRISTSVIETNIDTDQKQYHIYIGRGLDLGRIQGI
jgi:hypothetical protein